MSEILQIRWRIFFILTKSQKWGFYSQKTLLLKGAKNHWVKKVIKSKNDKTKSCPKFYKFDDNFFYFDEFLKKRLLQLKNDLLIMYIIYIINHAFLALEPPKIKILQKDYRHHILTYWDDLKSFSIPMGYGGVKSPPPYEGLMRSNSYFYGGRR